MGRAKLRKSGPYLWLNSQTGYYCAVFTDENGHSKRKSLKTKDKKETPSLPTEAAAVSGTSGASTYESIKKDTAKAKTKSKGS